MVVNGDNLYDLISCSSLVGIGIGIRIVIAIDLIWFYDICLLVGCDIANLIELNWIELFK